MKTSSLSLALAIITALGSSSLFVQAQTVTWDGGGANNNFNTGENWVDDTAPTAATTTAYTFSGSTRLTPNIQSGNYNISSITFDSTAGAFVIGPGGSPTDNRFQAPIGVNPTITQNSANDQIINAAIYNAGANTMTINGTGAGTLTVASLRYQANQTYAISAARNVIFDNITWVGNNPGTGLINLVAQVGATKFTFAGTNFQSLGTMTIGAGGNHTIEATNASGFSTSGNIISSQNATFTGAGSIAFTGNFTQTGSVDKINTFETATTLGSSGRTIQLGDANGTGNRTITFFTSEEVTSELAGSVTGSASSGVTSLTKDGAGTLILSGGGNHNGATLVSAGTLLINSDFSGATGTVTVSSGAAVGGSGTIGGSLMFDSGAKFVFSLTDTLIVDGDSMNFGGFGIADLVGLDSSVAVGIYTLIDGAAEIDWNNVSNIGAANAYALGDGKSAYFQEGSLQVVVVPEPSTFVSLIFGGIAAMLLYRRRNPWRFQG
jgi:autotransporter-associated beta strand protein